MALEHPCFATFGATFRKFVEDVQKKWGLKDHQPFERCPAVRKISNGCVSLTYSYNFNVLNPELQDRVSRGNLQASFEKLTPNIWAKPREFKSNTETTYRKPSLT